jgi:hypothetical protein
MGRTIIKFAGQRSESEENGTPPRQRSFPSTEEEALQRVEGDGAEVVDGIFLQKFFLKAFSHLSPSAADQCSTLYSSLQGDAEELNSQNLIFEDWNC